LLKRAGLPVIPPEEMGPDDFLQPMAVDKKVQAGRIRFVLLRHLGEAAVTGEYPEEILHATLTANYRAIVQELSDC
jgi:3-dehydroquinate synthase